MGFCWTLPLLEIEGIFSYPSLNSHRGLQIDQGSEGIGDGR